MDLGLFQKDIAKIIGTTTCTVTNWEKNYKSPMIGFMPAIIEFLGYIPFKIGESQVEQLLAYRRIREITKKKLAAEWEADITTLMRWEGGMKPQKIKHRKLVERVADRLIEELGLVVCPDGLGISQDSNPGCC